MSMFAPVAPVHILQQLLNADKAQLFGCYHLLLAHHTVEKEEEFQELFAQYMREKSQHANYLTVIMDNSIVELGGAVDDGMIAKSVEILHSVGVPRVIPVLPDVMGDFAATIYESSVAYERWTRSSMMPGSSYMVVLQATTFEEFCKAVDHFFLSEKYIGIQWAGIPRILVKQIGTRQRCVEYLRAVAPAVRIHLLGFSDDVVDDILCASMHGVTGIDSAVPVRVADRQFTPTLEVPPRDPNWFEEGVLTVEALNNINKVRRWVGVQR